MKQSPLPGQELAFVDFKAPAEEGQYTRPSVTADIEKANLLTSRVVQTDEFNLFGEERHKVVIDIDHGAQLIPSSTSGHFHLIIDHEIGWSQYVALLEAMADCGLVERGYVYASKERGYTAVRLPWIKKEGKSDVY